MNRLAGQPGRTAMMRNAWLVAAAVAACNSSAFAQKPIKEESIRVDIGPPPSSVREMATAAAAIVLAKYTGRTQPIESQDRGIPLPPTTAYTFEIADIVKLHQYMPFVGSELQVELPGQVRELATHILRTRDRDTDALIENRTYLLFLGWNWYREKLVLAYGASGVYDVTDGRVRSIHALGRHLDGTSAASFLSELRAAAK